MPITLTTLIMSSNKMRRLANFLWPRVKPLLLYLLVVAVLITIALIPMGIVWGFDLQDTAFLILVIGDIAVIAIFVIAFLAIGVRFIIKDVTKREELFCDSCGEDLDKGLICLNCGFDNRKIVDSN